MKQIGHSLYFLVLFSTQVLFAQNLQISGSVIRETDSVYLVVANNKKFAEAQVKYKITAVSAEVQLGVELLKTGDFLSGSAELRDSSKLLLYSIDYIGLTELIGSWKVIESGEILNFVSFFSIEGPSASKFTYLLSPKSTGLEVIISSANAFVVGTIRNRTLKSFSMEFDNSSKILSFEKLK